MVEKRLVLSCGCEVADEDPKRPPAGLSCCWVWNSELVCVLGSLGTLLWLPFELNCILHLLTTMNSLSWC